MFKTKVKRLAMASALAASCAVGLLAASPSPAWAGTTASSIYLALPYPPLIEVPGWSTASGTGLDLWERNSKYGTWDRPGANQQWSLPTNGHGGIDGAVGFVKNVYSGLCIETDGHAGNAVYQAPCNGSAHQQWRFDQFRLWDWGNGNWAYYFHITNPYSGLELNANQDAYANGTAVIVWWPQAGDVVDNEAWEIEQ